LTINGNDHPINGGDVLNVDDSGDTDANDGTLTDITLTGLGMAGSIGYYTIESLNIGLVREETPSRSSPPTPAPPC